MDEYEELNCDTAQYERVSLFQEHGLHESARRRMCTIVHDLDEEIKANNLVRRDSRMSSKRNMQSIVIELEDELHEKPRDLTPRERVKMLLESTLFQACMASCIVANAVVIGGETDYPDLEIWSVVENVFLIIFSSELLLRLLSLGLRNFFFGGEDQLWNIFDFSIVSLGILDCVGSAFSAVQDTSVSQTDDSQNSGGGVTTLFRMIRLLRILRVFKIIRFLKQLYMIIFGFVEAIQAICLVSVLMFFVLYICAVVMVRTYGRLTLVDDQHAIVATQFKSIRVAMLSLFELMSDPGNLKIYHSSMGVFPVLTIFLIAFVIFGSFGMIALLTGVISESMFDKNQARVQELRQERERNREIMRQKCIDLFDLVDKNDSGAAFPVDVQEVLPFVREMFEKLNIEYAEHEFDVVLSTCDIDESGTITEADFVNGVLSLCDGVRAASILEVMNLVSHMNDKVRTIQKETKRIYDEVEELSKRTLPGLQGDIRNFVHESGVKPLSRPGRRRHTSADVVRPNSAGGLTPLTESDLGDEKVPTTKQMDDHAVLIPKSLEELYTQKIDDLKAQLTESLLADLQASMDLNTRKIDERAVLISNKIDSLNTVVISNKIDALRSVVQDLVNAQTFTLQEAQISSRSWANFECPLPPEPQTKSDSGIVAEGLASTSQRFLHGAIREAANGSGGFSTAAGQHDNVQRSATFSVPHAGRIDRLDPHGFSLADPSNN